MIEKLKGLLKQQIDGVLERIDEDEEQKTENSGEEIYDENGQMTASSQKINRSEGAGKQNSSSTRKIINNMVQNDEGVQQFIVDGGEDMNQQMRQHHEVVYQ